MGYEIAKSVVYKSRNEIIITSASNNVRPLLFEKFTFTNGAISFIRNLSMKMIQINESANNHFWFYVLNEYEKKLKEMGIDFRKLHYIDKNDTNKWEIYVSLFEDIMRKGRELNKKKFILRDSSGDYYIIENHYRNRFYVTEDRKNAKEFKGLDAYYYNVKYNVIISEEIR